VGLGANALASSDGGASAPRRLVTVTGTATVSTRPDEALVDLGVRSEGADAEAAMQASAAKMTAILGALADAGIARSDIETTNVSLGRSTLDRGKPSERTVYVAQNTVQVTITDLANAGKAIDAAVSAGANEVHDIRFQVSNPSEVQRQALQEAVRTAREKADAMASAAGAQVDGVVSIREQSNPVPQSYNQAFAMAAVPAATPIVPIHEIQTRVVVSVVWSLA
jgi:uncharacterized protein YggE